MNDWLTAGAFTYDDLGRRTQVTRYNGVTTSYGYNTASQLTSLSHDLAGTANDLSYAFTYTPAPQIAGRTVSNSVYAYTPTTGTTSYANGLIQVTTAGGLGVTWDARGNLTSDGVRSYTYDAANRMLTGGGSTLTYDPLDRLYERTGTGGGRFLYDGSQLAGVFDGAGTMTEHWVAGPNPDEWLMLGSDQWYWPLQDAQGSVVAMTDGWGNATATLAYDEYGQPRAGNTGRMQYTGQMWLPDLGVYHYKARGYLPGLGRFLQTDPVGYEQGMNLYSYVRNDPVNATDPSGRVPTTFQDPPPCNDNGCPEDRARDLVGPVQDLQRAIIASGRIVIEADAPNTADLVDAVRGADNALGAVGTIVDIVLEIPRVARETSTGTSIDEALVSAAGRIAATEVASNASGAALALALTPEGGPLGAAAGAVGGSILGATVVDETGARERAGRAAVRVWRALGF